LQRVAVIGLGRTETLKVVPFDVVEVRPDGAVALLLSAQAADMARTTAARTNRIGFVTMPPRDPIILETNVVRSRCQ
jgi:hypothetical protein